MKRERNYKPLDQLINSKYWGESDGIVMVLEHACTAIQSNIRTDKKEENEVIIRIRELAETFKKIQ